jgi:serine/threonine protein kinase
MAFQFVKQYPGIYTIIVNDKGYIYKTAKNDTLIPDLQDEYLMIQKMTLISDIFKTFDNYVDCNISSSRICFPFYHSTLNIAKSKIDKDFDKNFKEAFAFMYSELDKNLLTFYDYCFKHRRKYITSIIDIIDKVEMIFRPNNFIHGDFKGNNIMIDSITDSVKIIDLDFSLICSDINILQHNNYIYLYLGKVTVTKRYLFLFDIYILVASIVTCTNFFPKHIYYIMEKYYLSKTDHNETFMDFFVIFVAINKVNCKLNNNSIDGKFETINKCILDCSTINYNQKYTDHVLLLQNIVLNNVQLNIEEPILGKRSFTSISSNDKKFKCIV